MSMCKSNLYLYIFPNLSLMDICGKAHQRAENTKTYNLLGRRRRRMTDTKVVEAIRKRLRKANITPDKLSAWKKQYDLEHDKSYQRDLRSQFIGVPNTKLKQSTC